MTEIDLADEGPGVYLVKPAVQNYAWGKIGIASQVAKFMATSQPDTFRIDETAPYAELWMGSHPKGPNIVQGLNVEDVTLKSLVERFPQLLGDASIENFGHGTLPFLFKVLSVEKALSIQAHPNKELAQKMHVKFPQHYPDKNHKPEMAIALTPFEGFCGFRPYSEIHQFLMEVPEFRQVVTEGLATAFCQAISEDASPHIQRFALKAMFSSMYDREASFVKNLVVDMLDRLKALPGHSELLNPLVELLNRLQSQFPGDVGIFCTFFFNRLQLKPGQAMYLGANEPHAYLAGDCIECMANSDNVVRAGLTPKFKDVKTLCQMLNYEGSPAESKLFESVTNGNLTNYKPPINDFAVQRAIVAAGNDLELPVKPCASMMIITRGEGVAYVGKKETGGVSQLFFKPGSVFFIGALKSVRIQNIEREFPMIIYRAFCNL